MVLTSLADFWQHLIMLHLLFITPKKHFGQTAKTGQKQIKSQKTQKDMDKVKNPVKKKLCQTFAGFQVDVSATFKLFFSFYLIFYVCKKMHN